MAASRMSPAAIVLLLGACLLPVPGARAALPTLVAERPVPAAAGGEGTTSAACTMEPGPIETAFSYAWTSPDAFSTLAWRIPRASCVACGPNYGLEIKTVTFRVRWFGACAAQAEVSVVGATGPTGCRVPDPNQVLCPPSTYAVVGVAPGGTLHTLTLPVGCCVGPEAFVMIHFTGLGSCYAPGTPSPGLTRSSVPCVGCTEYVSTTVTWPTLSDWCPIASGPLWLSVEADCCGPVGVEDDPVSSATAISVLDGPSRAPRIRILLAGTARRRVELTVYDIAGRRVRTLLRGELEGGARTVTWDGSSDAGARLPAGIYKVRLAAGAERAVATAVLLD